MKHRLAGFTRTDTLLPYTTLFRYKATISCFRYDTRLRCLENGRNSGKGSPMACCAVYWGKHPQRFADAFAEHGATLELSGISLPDNVKQAKLKLVMS